MQLLRDMTIIKNEAVCDDIFRMQLLDAPGMARLYHPGTFVNIDLPEHRELILRRPISVADYDNNTGIVTLLYQVRGKGTAYFSQKADGKLNVLGPVGNGFVVPEGAKKCLLIGGGLGCAPIFSMPKAYPTVSFDAVLGFRNAQSAILVDEYQSRCDAVIIATEDGSLGTKGFVSDVLPPLLQYDAVFVCGPSPMYHALKPFMDDVLCYVSLEERMGCGMGACVTCACAIERSEGVVNKRVCKDGPVFLLKEVVL